MKKTNIIAMALVGLAALPVIAADDSKPTAGELLQGINMFTPEEGDPAYKVTAYEKYGTQWYADAAYGYWQADNAIPGTNRHNNFFLVHAVLNQRLIEDSVNGGTWFRAEFSGSWGLDRRSAKTDSLFSDGFGNVSYVHTDIYGPADAVLPELSIMHYFNGGKSCVIGGVVNLTNYFDCVSIANDSFSSFVNYSFVNTSIVPLTDANLGVILQQELNESNYLMGALSRTDSTYRSNPFNFGDGHSYVVVAEWGHIFADGDATFRLTPFYQGIDNKGESNDRNWGVAASIEYALCDTCTVYARTGIARYDELGNSAELSMGTHVKLIPSREDDFLGISYGIFKGAINNDEAPSYIDEETEEPGHKHEQVVEVMYSLQVNDYFKIVPHYQFIKNPAYRSTSHESLWGVQTVFSF